MAYIFMQTNTHTRGQTYMHEYVQSLKRDKTNTAGKILYIYIYILREREERERERERVLWHKIFSQLYEKNAVCTKHIVNTKLLLNFEGKNIHFRL